VVRAANNDAMESMKQLESVIVSQANVKAIEYIPPGHEWSEIVLIAEPNPNAIGKVYRQWASKIAVLLQSRPAKQIRDNIEKGSYSLGIEGQMVKIEANMVSFTTSLPDNVVGAKFSGGDLFMDFEITPEIEAEGFARELIRRIQQMRKDIKLNVEEYVRVEVKASAKLIEYFKLWHDHIMSETRCRRLEFMDNPTGDHTASWEVDGEKLHVAISSLHFKQALDELLTINGLSQEGGLALIEAGYRSLSELKPLSEESLSNIIGLPKSDVKKIVHHLSRSEEQEAEPSKGPAGPERVMSKDELVPYLLRIPRMNEVKAEMLYEAGYNSIEKIKAASKEDLRKVKGMGEKTVVEIVAYASEAGFETKVKCANCGSLVPPDKLNCPTCGTKVSIESLAEEEKGESMPASTTDIDLERSFTYLIKEEKAERSYQLFERALSKGMKGFCVTRNYPLKIKARWNLGDTPILWLSNVGKESSIRPKDLEKLSVSLEQFLAQAEGGVILLDGLEYLITNNNFLTVLRLVQSLRDQVAINHSILMLVLNPSTLDAHELNLLEKEVDATI
jgi:archaellum component FlaF (FlaF/FlaG flagellin family)